MSTPPDQSPPNADDAVGRLIDDLIGVDGSKEAFVRLLHDQPGVLGAGVEERLLDMAQMPGYEATFVAFATLLRDARDDPERAWGTFEETMAAATALGEEVERADARITDALNAGHPGEALELLQDSIEKATRAGLGIIVADLHLRAGQVMIRGGVAERDEEVETAIAEFEAALRSAGPPEQVASSLMHLGLAGPERVRGDRRENADQGIEALRAALDVLGDDQPSELDACIRTNLASVLLGRESDDRIQNLTEARQLVERALEFRSLDRDATNWAYSQINLGLILDRLADEGVGDPADAVAAWQVVIDEADRCPAYLVGAAHHGIGQQLRVKAEPCVEDMTEEELEQLDDFDVDRQLLEDARDHLRQSRTLLVDAPDQLARGRTLDSLAGALTSLGEIDQAIVVGAEALELLGPRTSPRDCVIVAGRLGSQLADRDDWEGAAAVFRAGVIAGELAIDTRLDAPDRRREAQRGGNIARWASYCMARSAEPVEAALVLENGRTREVRRRLGTAGLNEQASDHLPEELNQAYESALTKLSTARLDGSGSNASRALQEVLHRIRAEPGFESFAAGTGEDGLRRAVEPHWPLLYVNPTPWGTLLALVRTARGRLEVTSEFLAPTSTEVFFRLLVGDAAETMDLDEDSDARSYLFGITTSDDRDLRDDLEQALPWLGQQLCHPIGQLLQNEGAGGVTLVLCGPLAAAPVHAAPWTTSSGERCLLDEVDIRFAPSAVLAAASIARAGAAEKVAPQLLALANPGRGGELLAAVPEAREVAQHFAPDRRLVFEGPDATSAALVDHAGDATHIHFACHAEGGLFEASESAVMLADRDVSALELTSLVGLETRLVSISACRSAMAEITEMVDEVMSFGTAVLAAGSACAIATLWPVDDAAAALLMIKMYDELEEPNTTPPQALRRSQLWLRDLTPDQQDRYLKAHPALAAEFRRRSAAGDAPGRRGSGSGSSSGTFAHPDYWAPFIASGA